MVQTISIKVTQACENALSGKREDVTRLTQINQVVGSRATEARAATDSAGRRWEQARTEAANARAGLLAAVGTPSYEQAASRLVGALSEFSSARKDYVRWIALAAGFSQLASISGQCMEMAGLKPDTKWVDFSQPPPSAGVGACAAQEGPLSCTGEFPGKYETRCVISSLNDSGTGGLRLFANGEFELRYHSSRGVSTPPPLQGTVDATGRVLVERRGISHVERWEGQLRVDASGDGVRSLIGSGTYQYLTVREDGATDLDCTGTFRLDAGW
jgi:hypothetical protein